MPRSIGRNLIPQEKIRTVELYQSGLSVTEIANIMNVMRKTVYRHVKYAGITLDRRRRKFTVETNRITDVNSQISAYWMGFFLADGYISNQNQVYLQLAIKDVNHVRKFSNFIKIPREISIRQQVRNGKYHSAARTWFTSMELTKRFASLGIYRRDGSRPIGPPLIDSRHFWRGVIDGDGHLSITRRGYPNLVLVGREEVLNAFLEFGNQYFKFLRPSRWLKQNGARVTKNPDEKIHRLQFIAQRAECLIHVLYEDAQIYLDRKKLIADSVIHYSDSPF